MSTGSVARAGRMSMAVGGAFAAALLLLAPTWTDFAAVWESGGAYPHGWVILGFCAFLVWRVYPSLGAAEEGWPPVAIPLAGLSLFWLVSVVADVRVGHVFAFPFLLLGWGTVVWGERGFRRLAPIAATFLLAVPFWELLIRPLQLATILVSGVAVKLMGIEAVVRGDTITIQYGTFLVEGSCAGLGYFLTGLVVGVLYAHLFMRSAKGKWAVIFLAGGLAILSNWIRVSSLILIGEVTEMQSSLMASHGTYGWVLFSVALVPFFLLAQRLEKWDRKWAGQAEAGRGATGTEDAVVSDATDAGRSDDSAESVPGGGRSGHAFLATSALAVGPLLFMALSALPPTEMEPGSFSPPEGWVAEESQGQLDALPEVRFPAPDLRRDFVFASDSGTVVTRRFVYDEQEQGRELVNSQNGIAADSLVVRERTVGPLDRRGRTVREAWLVTPDGMALTWYWYRVAGIDTASGARAKLLELVAFVTRRRQAELVTVTARCREDDCEPAARRLFAFMTGEFPGT